MRRIFLSLLKKISAGIGLAGQSVLTATQLSSVAFKTGKTFLKV